MSTAIYSLPRPLAPAPAPRRTPLPRTTGTGEASDAALIAEVLDGRREAFATLLARYQPQARAIAGRYLKQDHAGLEDVLAEAACRAYSHLPVLRDGRCFRSWYCTIVRNAALDYAVRSQREQGPGTETRDQEGSDQWWALLPDAAPTPEARVSKAQEVALVLKALDTLEPLYREPVVQRCLHDRSYEEIARDLGKPVGTVKCL
ncbi:MAG TPA: RNA polymerase sigma factor, partial [bacterium]|nr:RNA polymerase sigma factor [bacterium]